MKTDHMGSDFMGGGDWGLLLLGRGLGLRPPAGRGLEASNCCISQVSECFEHWSNEF